MKKWICILLTCLLCLSLTACFGGQQPQREPVSTAHSTDVMPEGLTVTEDTGWPENTYTRDLPQAPGAVSWVMVDEARNTCGIQLNNVAKRDLKAYTKALEKAGFYAVERGAVSVGTLYSNGKTGLSFSFTEPVLMIGIFPLEGRAAAPASREKLTNAYINTYATYDEEEGVQGVAEFYMPEDSPLEPGFTALTGNLQLTLEEQHGTFYFGADEDHTEAIAAAISTGVTGSSGDQGAITISGFAYADNAVFGGGVFTVSYEIKLP